MSTATVASVVKKVNPGRVKTSGKFTAMLAYLLDQHGWTRPEIVDMKITSDDILLVGDENDPFLNQIVGNGSDLFRNLRGLARVAGLTKAETALLIARAEARTRV